MPLHIIKSEMLQSNETTKWIMFPIINLINMTD